MSQPLVIFLHSARYDRVFQAASLVLTAASAGRPCYLFLFYGALAGFMSGAWEDTDTIKGERNAAWRNHLARNFELADLPSPHDMLAMAKKESGELSVYACSTSLRMLDLDTAEVKRRIDHVAGLATMLEIAAGTANVLYI